MINYDDDDNHNYSFKITTKISQICRKPKKKIEKTFKTKKNVNKIRRSTTQ